MRVIAYAKVIPPGKALKPAKENHKYEILKNYIEGVRVNDDKGLLYECFDLMYQRLLWFDHLQFANRLLYIVL